MNQISNLIRKDLLSFQAYDLDCDDSREDIVWLNRNESPFNHLFFEDAPLNRYPEKQPSELRAKLACLFNVSQKQIALARGSDELIDILIRLFCIADKDAVVICPPTFGMYAIYSYLQAVSVISVPLIRENNFQLDVQEILKYENKMKILFLCSPNNPTGNLLQPETILNLCEQLTNKSVVVVDEAYIDYAQAGSLVNYINHYENLIILRTLSKAYGLAGARIGALVANENIIQWALKVMAPYPIPMPVAKLVMKLLTDAEITKIKSDINNIVHERNKLYQFLTKMNFVTTVWLSDANFILLEVDNSEKVIKSCRENGIFIRQIKALGIDALRITIGTPKENQLLKKVLRRLTL